MSLSSWMLESTEGRKEKEYDTGMEEEEEEEQEEEEEEEEQEEEEEKGAEAACSH